MVVTYIFYLLLLITISILLHITYWVAATWLAEDVIHTTGLVDVFVKVVIFLFISTTMVKLVNTDFGK